MHSAGSASKIKLNSFDDLFGVSDAEQIIQVELTELYPFKNHPFRVLDDKKWMKPQRVFRNMGY